ncbi:PREDICTED: PRUPE_6G029800 [Prunus dulcis]|uniref:PREDICTED: PRUPE_6G029800 n=1 Tax=Prunus dulcis TaxID=3755 RepID=A0A5E4ESZ1_PRUDU|nr:PREDICTED: PRUPE_6G029800 [Prunus dulcis]
MQDGFAFQMQRVPIPTLYLCLAENKQGNKVSYRIISVRLMDGMHAEIVKPEIEVVGYKCGEGLPLGMGVGIFRSNILLAGGLEAVYDCYTNFPPNVTGGSNNNRSCGRSRSSRFGCLQWLISLLPGNLQNCTPESDAVEAGDDIDEDDPDEYDQDNFDLEEHHYHRARPCRDYEWWGASIRGYLMSKDCKSLKLLKDLKVPEGILPRNRQHVRGMQFKLVHLGEQKVCLVMCVDYGHEPKDVEIHVIGFEFQLLPSRDALYFTMLNDVSQFIYHGDESFEPSTTGIYIHGAFFL